MTSKTEQIKRGQEAFNTLLDKGYEALHEVAEKYKVSMSTLKRDMHKYRINPIGLKPTDEQIFKYEKYIDQKRQSVYINAKDPSTVKNCQKSFEAFLQSADNSSAMVDLAVELETTVVTIKNNAHRYAQRTVDPKPTSEELATYQAIRQRLNENENINQKSFIPIKEILKLSANNLTSAYLEYAINSPFSLGTLFKRIELYKQKCSNEEEKAILNGIKEKFHTYEDYINKEKKLRKAGQYNADKVAIYKPIIREIMETYIIDDSKTLDYLINQNNISKETFDKYIKLFQSGDPEEQFLYNKYIKKQEFEMLEMAGYVQLIHYYLKNGMEKNGQTAKFNILDYYRIINMKLDVFLSKARKSLSKKLIERREYDEVANFLKINSQSTLFTSKEELLQYQYSTNNQSVSEEEGRKIIEELENQGIPLYLNVYHIAIDEYIKGNFVLNNLKFE